MVLGFASLTTISKPVRYSSRRVRSSRIGVAGHPAQLLAVGSKMLGAGGDAVFLDAPHIACRHFSREERVLRKILEVAAAEGAALDVQARAQQHSDLLRGGLFAHEPRRLASPRAGSQLLATVAAGGESRWPGHWGSGPDGPPRPACLRTPLGPSERVMAGMPFSEKSRVVKTVSPESRAHFCSKFNVFMMSVCFITISSFVPEQGKGPLFWCSGPLPLVQFRCCVGSGPRVRINRPLLPLPCASCTL